MLKLLGPLLALVLVAGCGANDKRTTVAVVGKSSSGEYWAAVKHGAEREADKASIKLMVTGPASEVDVAGQVEIMEDLIRRKVSGIALSPVDSAELSPVVKRAVDAGIKVVTIDSDTVGHDRLCYIGTNNERAGEVAGKAMLELMGGDPKAKIAIITGALGAKNLADRVAGFKKVVGDRLAMLDVETDFGNKDRSLAIAQATMTNHPEIGGFFSTTAIGGPAVAQALERAGKAGSIKVVSFDTTPTLIKQLKDGNVQVLIAQQPERMGELGVASLVKALHGEKLPPLIDTGVVAVTKATMSAYNY